MMPQLKNGKTVDAPAFAVYGASKIKKNKRRRNRRLKQMIPPNSEVEILGREGEGNIENPNVSPKSPHNLKKKTNKSNESYTYEENRANGFEVIDIDENSSEFIPLINSNNNSNKGKSKRRANAMNNDDVVILETIKKKSKKNRLETPQISIEEEEEEEAVMCSGNSIIEGRRLFAWVINPVVPEEFFKITWEKRPLHIKRGLTNYYQPILSTPIIDKMLRNCNVQFTKNLDITSYSNGKRETHNPVGRALPNIVWDYYKNGCSVRLLNPQTFIPKLALLNTSLQEYFGCFVGANAYLTPPDSQGFAPHYDDIEAFILQVEGKKQWKLYSPRSKSEVLPRFSSGNFNQDEIGQPIMDVLVEPGDLLYFPRGTIHQGHTVEGSHSLHITLSCYQKNTWGDLMEKVVTAALRSALEEDVEFRRGLPLNYLNYMGITHAEESSPERTEFKEKIKHFIGKLFDHAPIDSAVDQMGKQFMHDALPPTLTQEEKSCSSIGDGYTMEPNGELKNAVEINLKTRIKLLRAHILRLVTEEDGVRVYHNVDNSLEYHGEEPQYLEITAKLAPAIEQLIKSYPNFIEVSELPLETEEQKVTIVGDLWDRGLLLTDGPLKKIMQT